MVMIVITTAIMVVVIIRIITTMIRITKSTIIAVWVTSI